MIKYYIRKINGATNVSYTEEEYRRKIAEEFEELQELNLCNCDIIEDYIDEELLEIIEFNSESCETIKDAIRELFSYDTSDILDMNSIYNICKEDILKNNSITYYLLNSRGEYFNITFEIVEVDEDDILESKIKNVKLEII